MTENQTGPVPEGYPAKIDKAKRYKVQLLKAVPFAGTSLNPSSPLEISGEVLSGILAGEHKDSVYGATELTETVPD